MLTKTVQKQYEKRAAELVKAMTEEELIGQMMSDAPAIPRLGIPKYTWWNEALHGVARAGTATVFPQAIGLAATFDRSLARETGDIIATEARAKFNEARRQGDTEIYKGLTFWSPNINIFRDPRWGRGHETYGEDPYLTGEIGASFIHGIQGDDPEHLKAAACVKHFAVHSGPEMSRHHFDAQISKKDLWETYLPAFEKCIHAGTEAVMGAYNRLYGIPCCGDSWLIGKILREKFGFSGHVVSDCGAIHDFVESHHVCDTYEEAAAQAVNAGCDLNCGTVYRNLYAAFQDGLVTRKTLEISVFRLMMTRLKLGILAGDTTPYDNIPFTENDTPAHHAAAYRSACESMVLLKNDGVLPLNPQKAQTIAVIGPNADNFASLLGNYNGTPSEHITVLEGIRRYASDSVRVLYAQGCHLWNKKVEGCANDNDRMAEAISAAENADISILCVGLDATIEGEAGDAFNAEAGGDKITLELPGYQNELIHQITSRRGIGKKVIVVCLSGSAVNLSMADECADAVIQAWYPGQMGGLATADLLFGKYSPSGRLPVTFYRSADDLPAFDNYAMKGRTYRYFEGTPVYPFGFGLSYTHFRYRNIRADQTDITAGESITVSIDVTNIGEKDAAEVTELYLRDDEASCLSPKYALREFCRIMLLAGQTQTLHFVLTPEDMMLIREDGSKSMEPGYFTCYIGGSQPDPLSEAKMEASVPLLRFRVRSSSSYTENR